MQFVIEELILWPCDTELAPHTLKFSANKINVIHGRSGTGKSSVISIIDYCLGASRCAIPVGVIRDTVAWFGLKVQVRGEPLLLCRRSPDLARTGKEFVFLMDVIDLPAHPVPNCSASEFKARMNALTRLSNLPLGADDRVSQFDGRASYRDLAAFNFLPQHIVANPNTLFFKTDTYEHRERLKRLLPLALGITDNTYSANERERTQLEREAERLQRQRDDYRAALEPLATEVRRLWLEAVDVGLCEGEVPSTEQCIERFKSLQRDLEKDDLPARLRQPDYAVNDERFKEAVEAEERIQRGVDSIRRKVRDLQQLSTRGKAMQVAVEREGARVINFSWLQNAVQSEGRCVACGGPAHHLGKVIKNLEEQINQNRQLNKALVGNPIVDAEIEQNKNQLNVLAQDLHAARVRRMHLEQLGKAAKSSAGRLYLLLGEIKATVATYTKAGVLGPQDERLTEIERRLDELARYFERSDRRKREIVFDQVFSDKVMGYADGFELEYRGQVTLDKNELTLRFQRDNGRPEFLWEVGSGANWMGYHLACFFALHEYLSTPNRPEAPIFSFLVIDQPSQVYFPSAASGANELDQSQKNLDLLLASRNHDVIATRRIFEMLERTRQTGNFQIIVLEHADNTIWGGLPNTKEAANWKEKGEGLIPLSWQRN